MMGDETVIWEGHPTWRATLSFHLKWFAVTVVLVLLLFLAKWLGLALSAAVPIAVLVAGIALTVAVGWVHRFFTQYAITTKRLDIRHGILSKTEISANVDRIQNMTVYQSLVDRILRVGSIEFDTASDDPSDRFSFAGVNRPQDLREQIMRARDTERTWSRPDGQGGLA